MISFASSNMKFPSNLFRVSFLPILLLASCASRPKTDDVAQFGTATMNAVAVIREPGQLESDLAIAYSTETNLCRYVSLSIPACGTSFAKSCRAS